LEQHPIIALSLFSDGSNAVGPNTELRRVLEIMLTVYPLLYYFVRDQAMITLYKALVTALLNVLDWVLLVWIPSLKVSGFYTCLHLDRACICILRASPHATLMSLVRT